MGREKTNEELYSWFDEDYYKRFPEDRFHEDYGERVKEKFREAIKILEKAETYVHEIDYLLSGDTGEDSFLERLKEKL